MDTARADGPELDQLAELLRLWAAAFGKESLTVKDAVLAAATKEESVMGEPADLRHPEQQYAPRARCPMEKRRAGEARAGAYKPALTAHLLGVAGGGYECVASEIRPRKSRALSAP